MPTRQKIDPLVLRLGERIRELRRAKSLSLEQMTWGADLSGKGYLSQTERGLALPTLTTLSKLAASLGVTLVDLVNFPELGPRNELLEVTRNLGQDDLQRLLDLSRELRARLAPPPTAVAAPRSILRRSRIKKPSPAP